MSAFEITGFAKSGGALTKRISLDPDGKLISDGSACVMSRGAARRVHFDDLAAFAACIEALDPNEAIALGSLRNDLPDQVEIVTKRKLDELNGAAQPNMIARTGSHIVYRVGQPTLALFDYDTKGQPHEVVTRISELGGYWAALRTVLPALAGAAAIQRRSTSTGLFRTDTGEQLPGSSGLHLYVLVQNGADVERFLRTLHDRCWLAGLGWSMVGAGGQLLERSIVDRMVGAPERLVFEGAPILEPPLAQDQAKRRTSVRSGDALDTLAACPPLSILEQAKLRELRAKEAHRLAPQSAKARETFITEQAQRLAQSAGIATEQARHIIERQCRGFLLPNLTLPFDDDDLAGATVADVLADPTRFEGATLADPLEGVEYGRCKAKVMRRADGSVWIHSFAHGRTDYQIKLDAAACKTALEAAPKNEAANTFVRLALAADLAPDQIEELRDLAANRAGIGKRTIERKLKDAHQEQRHQRAQEERYRQAAERIDPRPQIVAPAPDAPWLPLVQVLNDTIGASQAAEPPARDIDGDAMRKKERLFPQLHLLGTASTNPRDE